MPGEPIIDPKIKALIALGASVAAGCQPCTEFHVESARAAGACDRGVQFAVESALAVRQSATRAIDRWSERVQGVRPELDGAFRADRQLLAELVAVASAICVQSVPDLVLHLAEAQRLGATPEMIRATAGIARSIHSVAREQVEAALAGASEEVAPAAQDDARCGTAQPCGCR